MLNAATLYSRQSDIVALVTFKQFV